MIGFVKKAALGAVLAATVVGASSPAEAHDRRYRNNDAGVAIGAGVLGLALGAAIASDRRDRYYDDGYYYRPYPRYRAYRYYGPPPRYYRYERPWRGDRYYRYGRRW
jgi:hypothetical protein